MMIRSSSKVKRNKNKRRSPLHKEWRNFTFTKGETKVWIDESRKNKKPAE
jgi:hypothetical protein